MRAHHRRRDKRARKKNRRGAKKEDWNSGGGQTNQRRRGVFRSRPHCSVIPFTPATPDKRISAHAAALRRQRDADNTLVLPGPLVLRVGDVHTHGNAGWVSGSSSRHSRRPAGHPGQGNSSGPRQSVRTVVDELHVMAEVGTGRSAITFCSRSRSCRRTRRTSH